MSDPRQYRAIRYPGKALWAIEIRKRLGQAAPGVPTFTTEALATNEIGRLIDNETDPGAESAWYDQANPPPGAP